MAKKNPKQTAPAVGKDICFTIMPFGGWLDDYYESVYSPAIKAAGLEPHRADDLFRPSTIVHDIWDYTKRAKIILADLSGKNPNVFYELGLAHALVKPAILVAESMDEIPFDLRALRIIIYEKNAPNWGQILREKIEASIGEVLKSPLEAVLPAFLEVRASAGKAPISEHEKEIIEIKQELDLLRREMRSSGGALDAVPARRVTTADEARAVINKYIHMGIPSEMIIDRVSAMGVPGRWVAEEIDILRKRRMKTLRRPKRRA